MNQVLSKNLEIFMLTPWKKGAITVNPYHETAFQVLGITRGVTSRAEIGRKVEERRQAVRNVPGHYRIHSRPITQTDITTAREILFNPTLRIIEELLEHKPGTPCVEDIQRLREQFPPPPWLELTPIPIRMIFLIPIILDLIREYIVSLPSLEVAPVSPHLQWIPPFYPDGFLLIKNQKEV